MILFKKQLFDLEVKGQGPTKVIMVRDTPPYGHAPTYQLSLTSKDRKVMVRTSFAEKKQKKRRKKKKKRKKKIRLKQYVSLRSKGRHNKTYDILKDTLLKIIFVESLPTRQI
jgi:hypothetical protein